MHLGITEKQTSDCAPCTIMQILIYEIYEHICLRQPHGHLALLSGEPPEYLLLDTRIIC